MSELNQSLLDYAAPRPKVDRGTTGVSLPDAVRLTGLSRPNPPLAQQRNRTFPNPPFIIGSLAICPQLCPKTGPVVQA